MANTDEELTGPIFMTDIATLHSHCVRLTGPTLHSNSMDPVFRFSERK